MSPKVAIRDIRREELTLAAMKCIASKGYHAVTLDDVTREAGLSKGIAAYYFKNREDLLVSVIRRMRDDVVELTGRIWGLPWEGNETEDFYRDLRKYYASEDIDPRSVIRNGIRTLFSWVDESPHVLKVILEFWCQLPRNPVIGELNEAVKRHLQRTSSIILDEGMKRGVFRKRDPNLAATTLLSAITGLALAQIVYKREFDNRKLEKALEDLIFGYLVG